MSILSTILTSLFGSLIAGVQQWFRARKFARLQAERKTLRARGEAEERVRKVEDDMEAVAKVIHEKVTPEDPEKQLEELRKLGGGQ